MSVLGIAELLAVFRDLGDNMQERLTDPARQEAEAIKRRIESRAPGHLGQNWKITTKDGEAYLSNDAPDWHRYEYGFNGTDALGRHVSQPPRPVVRPALAGQGQAFMDRIAELFD